MPTSPGVPRRRSSPRRHSHGCAPATPPTVDDATRSTRDGATVTKPFSARTANPGRISSPNTGSSLARRGRLVLICGGQHPRIERRERRCAQLSREARPGLERVHSSPSVELPDQFADGLVATLTAWLEELGAASPLVEALAEAVRGDWPTAHALRDFLSVEVSLAV